MAIINANVRVCLQRILSGAKYIFGLVMFVCVCLWLCVFRGKEPISVKLIFKITEEITITVAISHIKAIQIQMREIDEN